MYKVARSGLLKLALGSILVISILIISTKVSMYAVVTDSMKPQINPGDLVIVAQMPVYAIGDIIAARVGDKIFLHRIIDIDYVNSVYFIRGDNAYNIDYITPENVVGKVLLKIPLAGYAIIYKPVSILILLLLIVILYRSEILQSIRSRRLALLILIGASILATPAAAGGIVLESEYPFPVMLSVNGSVYLVDSRVQVAGSGVVCIVDPQVYYISSESRFSFKGLSVNNEFIESSCVNAGPGSIVKPVYTVEVMVKVVSTPPGIINEVLWVEQGAQIVYKPPGVVEDELQRLELKRVAGAIYTGDGYVIIADSPKVVVVEYERLLKVRVGQEVYVAPEGSSIVIDLRSLEVRQGDGVKLAPSKLIYNGRVYNVEGADTFILPVDSPGEVEVVYTRVYLVRIHTADGITDRWVPEGDSIIVKFTREIQLGPREKLVLSHIIDNNITLYTTNLSITVDRPHYIKAVYDRYYNIRVSSILGERQAWAKMGTHYTVSFPPELQGFLTYFKLDGILVNSVFHKPGPDSSLAIYVDGPKDVVAVYVKKADYVNLVLVATPIAVVTAAAVLYIYDRYLKEEASEASRREPKSSGEGRDRA